MSSSLAAAAHPSTPASATPSIGELRTRVQHLQGTGVSRELPLLPVFDGLVSLRTGMSCSVDTPRLAMALLAGPSHAGEWVAIVGAPDFGLEAATALGVTLERTIVVPDPGEHWLSVTATLVDVASVVLVQPPPTGVAEAQALRLSARLRQKDAALIAWGEWPRSSVRLSAAGTRWTGVGQGWGHLDGCDLDLVIHASGQRPRTASVTLTGQGRELSMAVGERDESRRRDARLMRVG